MDDFTVTGDGSLYILTPNTPAAEEWVDEHIPQDSMWFGTGVAVEHRYIGPIVEGIVADGLSVN